MRRKGCHFQMERRHKKRCPDCGGWMPNDPFIDVCRKCDDKNHPEKAEARRLKREQSEIDRIKSKKARNAKNRERRRKHPCSFITVSGKCQKSTFGAMCPYAASKALEHCDEAIAKKGVKV